MFKRIATLLSCALLFAIGLAKADAWDKKTVMTFSQPVELPGIVLPAGTYVFKLLDSPSERHIVQVFDKDETKIFATILAIPNYRLKPAEDTVLRFEERPRGVPDAVKAWFYPGDNFGQEFAYPKLRAMNLAEETKAPVLAAEVTPEKPEELLEAPVVMVEPPKEPVVTEESWAEAPVAEPEPLPLEMPAPVPVLPETASNLPMIALLAAGSLGLAGILHLMSRT